MISNFSSLVNICAYGSYQGELAEMKLDMGILSPLAKGYHDIIAAMPSALLCLLV